MAYNHEIKAKYRGFTVVELLVVAPVVILLIGIFISAIMAMTGDVLSTRGQAEVLYDVRYALDVIERDAKTSGAYLATNNITISSPQGLNDDTTSFTNADSATGSTLILNSYATTSNPIGETRTAIYISSPNACSSTQVSQNKKLTTNIVYFLKANSSGDYTLWKRTIMSSNYATIGCTQPWQQPSCSPGHSASFCKIEDTKLVDGIAAGGFSIKYYENADHTTVSSTASSSSATDAQRQVALATTAEIEITISSSRIVAGETISQTGTIKVTSPNNNIAAASSPEIKVLVVAGGGGGGSSTTAAGGAGGGGAGGLIYDPAYQIASGDDITITVGTGGAAGAANGSAQGTNGTNSVFNPVFRTITATGGGGGGRTTGNGSDGGPGGGGVGGLGGPNQANNIGGSGGAGLAYSISGTSIIYAAGGSGGSISPAGPAGSTSPANTGKGGDGTYDASAAYDGSAGIVIISYPTGIITASGGTITTSGLYTIHTFTSDGTFTVS